jgi:hypothetical protein
VSDRTRTEHIADLHALADWLTAHPDAPVDKYTVRLQHHVNADSDAEGRAEIARLADALGTPVTNSARGAHHEFSVRIAGDLTYNAVWIDRGPQAEYVAFMATRPAWEAAQRAGVVSE